jgi:hypothetical protein
MVFVVNKRFQHHKDWGFIELVLKICQQRLERLYRYQAQRFDLGWLIAAVFEKAPVPGLWPHCATWPAR